MTIKLLHIIIILTLTTMSCQSPNAPKAQIRQSPSKSELIAANKLMVKKEKQDILDYIKRNGYTMQATGSGLYYHIYQKQTTSKCLTKGDMVHVNYTLSLLNGEQIYTKTDAKSYTLVIGKSDKESGLLEALCLMKRGEKALLIVPAHLGFGILGDQDKVAPKSSLVYDIEILQINPNTELQN